MLIVAYMGWIAMDGLDGSTVFLVERYEFGPLTFLDNRSSDHISIVELWSLLVGTEYRGKVQAVILAGTFLFVRLMVVLMTSYKQCSLSRPIYNTSMETLTVVAAAGSHTYKHDSQLY